MLNNLNKEIEKPQEKGAGSAANEPAGLSRDNPPQNPMPVEILQPNASPLQLIQQVAATLVQPLATVGIVVVFVIFFLLQREDLRDRFIRLAGAADLRRTTVALDDAASRLSRYLLTQTAINASFGLLVGAGLWLIGVPYPVLWGILAAFRPLYRPRYRCRTTRDRRTRRRSRVGDAALGNGSDPRRRVHHRVGDRALALWPQHRAIRHRGRGRGRLLDAVNAG
jgi:hypothetical protein